MPRDDGERGVDPDLAARVAAIPASGQRWLKMALVSIGEFDGADGGVEAPRSPKRRPRLRAEEATPDVEDALPPRKAPADLEDVVSGRARLEDQLKNYPELADELDGLADIIDLLRDAGQARRRKGEEVLRELGLSQEQRGEPEEEEEA
jgi:hypothetical protein